jgi:hypothetical protein
VGRLDNIIARNQRPHWSKNPVFIACAVAVVVVIVFVLVAFTDLAKPNMPPRQPTRVDGVYLR